jgi:hypothetical protein
VGDAPAATGRRAPGGGSAPVPGGAGVADRAMGKAQGVAYSQIQRRIREWIRNAEDGQLLGSWISASAVLGTPRPDVELEEGSPAGGEVRPQREAGVVR